MAEPYIGEIMMVGFNFAPRDWAPCEGQLLAITSYQALFALIGTTYGGDGRTTFALPDLRGRIPLHAGTSPEFPAIPYTLGQKAGAPTATLAMANLPAHTHPIAQPVSTAKGTSNDPDNAVPAVDVTTPDSHTDVNTYTTKSYAATPSAGHNAATFQSGPAGNATPTAIHTEPPVLPVYFVIALNGLFPTRN